MKLCKHQNLLDLRVITPMSYNNKCLVDTVYVVFNYNCLHCRANHAILKVASPQPSSPGKPITNIIGGWLLVSLLHVACEHKEERTLEKEVETLRLEIY